MHHDLFCEFYIADNLYSMLGMADRFPGFQIVRRYYVARQNNALQSGKRHGLAFWVETRKSVLLGNLLQRLFKPKPRRAALAA